MIAQLYSVLLPPIESTAPGFRNDNFLSTISFASKAKATKALKVWKTEGSDFIGMHEHSS